MTKKTYETECGVIRYWTNDIQPGRRTLVFLPGLTADHRLFDKQIEAFKDEFNVLVWDAPGHNESGERGHYASGVNRTVDGRLCVAVFLGKISRGSGGVCVNRFSAGEEMLCHGGGDLGFAPDRTDVPGVSVEFLKETRD